MEPKMLIPIREIKDPNGGGRVFDRVDAAEPALRPRFWARTAAMSGEIFVPTRTGSMALREKGGGKVDRRGRFIAG